MLILLQQEDKQLLLRYPETESDLLGISGENRNNETHPEQETRHEGDDETGLTILKPGQTLQGTGFKALDLTDIVAREPITLRGSFCTYTGSHLPLPNIRLTTQDVNRWTMAWRAYRHGFKYDLIVRRCKNWPNMYRLANFPIALGFSAAAFIYGGLHALAWFAHFDSSTEQLLWRISACIVMGGIPVSFVVYTSADHLYIPNSAKSRNRTELEFVTFLFLLSLVILILVAYTLARAYLVVECFINLSHLSAGVYDVPSWSTYFPHIS